MKGIVLAGGLGTRMGPATKVVNKHLLDVFDEPMIFFPIRTLARAGIADLILVAGADISQFKALLGTGGDFGVKIEYVSQENPVGGIADAISTAEPLAARERIAVILGDNIFQEDLSPQLSNFEEQGAGARILLKQVSKDEAHRFGVVEIDKGRVTRIEEKPPNPATDLVQTGFYLYDERVFALIKSLRPSSRGQLEVTDLNSIYVSEGTMTFGMATGWWTDAGTPPSKLKASILVALEKGVSFRG